MVIHVAERVASAIGAESTVIATEDQRIVDCAREFGFNAVITSDNATNGTARVWDVAQQMRADVYLNVQGDEPMVKPDDIGMILQKKISMPGYVINGMCPLGPQEDPVNVNIPLDSSEEVSELVVSIRTLARTAKGFARFPVWRAYLKSLMQGRTVIVVGYSGSDDFDITPVLLESEPAHMVWIDYASDEAPRKSDLASASMFVQRICTSLPSTYMRGNFGMVAARVLGDATPVVTGASVGVSSVCSGTGSGAIDSSTWRAVSGAGLVASTIAGLSARPKSSILIGAATFSPSLLISVMTTFSSAIS